MSGEWGFWWTVWNVVRWSYACGSDELRGGSEVFVDVLIVVDGPVLDVEAKVGRGIDASCRDGVKDHLKLRPTGRVTGDAEELDGEDVRVHELCLSGNEAVGFPDVSHAFAAHVVGGFDRHGDGRHRSGFVHESNIGPVGVKIQGYWATCQTGF